jgi:DNA-binding CsgD family transcriptional regulator/PAS domain-containing protein
MDEFEPAILTDLVGAIYESAVDPNHWSQLVTGLERIYPDSRVTLFGHNSTSPTANVGARVNYAEGDLRSYADYYITCSPYIARSLSLPVGRAFHYDMIVGDDELVRTEYYNDYLRPRRLGHYGTGLIVERTALRNGTVLSLADHKDDADRRARQLRLLDVLGPHLRRAFRLHRMVSAERAGAGAVRAVFDRWAHATLVYDAAGRIVTFNRAAAALLGRADGVWLGRGGQLCSADDARMEALELAVRKCAGVADNAASRATELDGIALPRPSGAPPLRVMMWPLMPGDGGGAVLVVILDPTRVQRTPVGWLAKQYGLSPSEQRLAEAIVNGTPLNEAAEQLGIRLSTARTRLKTIQTKTHCRRQVDLVRLALSLPAVREA